jgi:hypothetical protein
MNAATVTKFPPAKAPQPHKPLPPRKPGESLKSFRRRLAARLGTSLKTVTDVSMKFGVYPGKSKSASKA